MKTIKDMKNKVLEIIDKFCKDEFTRDEAESLLLGLSGVSGVEELNQKIDNNISRIKAEIKKKINEKNILRTQIEILNQELWELEKLMYNEESDRGKRND